MSVPDIRVQIDPTCAMSEKGYALGDIIQLTGLVGEWGKMYHHETKQPLRKFMEECYGFPLSFDETGHFDSNNIYHYPGDEPLSPVAVFKYPSGQQMNIYLYGLVSFLDFDNNGKLTQYHTRMD